MSQNSKTTRVLERNKGDKRKEGERKKDKTIIAWKTAHPIGISYVLSTYLPDGSVSHVSVGKSYRINTFLP